MRSSPTPKSNSDGKRSCKPRTPQRAVDLARAAYASGLRDFQNVLDAERSLLSFQDQLAQSEGQVTSHLIRLYKALGGGWAPLTDANAAQ